MLRPRSPKEKGGGTSLSHRLKKGHSLTDQGWLRPLEYLLLERAPDTDIEFATDDIVDAGIGRRVRDEGRRSQRRLAIKKIGDTTLQFDLVSDHVGKVIFRRNVDIGDVADIIVGI